jgi:hypothetical protein
VVYLEVEMIKKQYERSQTRYFNNFILSHNGEDIIEEELKPYKATLAKSKNKYYKMNIKWHDEKLYMMFVLRYS